MTLIELNQVTHAYPLHGAAPIPALRGITLHIDEGEFVAVVGANGSGKSTLARHLNALQLPDQGTVHIAGKDTRDPAQHPEIRRTVGIVFQHPENQMIATTVEEDVAFGPENLGLPSDEIQARVRESLQAVELWEARARPPTMLSAGQIQRVALAGVLAMRPRCILFDEVTAMLDPAGRQATRAMMRRLHREGLTVITITHFMEEAAEAERIIVLDQGRVALDASPDVVFSDPRRLHVLGLALPPITQLAHTLSPYIPSLPPNILTRQALIEALPPHSQNLASHSPPLISRSPRPDVPKPPLLSVQGLAHTYMEGTPLAHTALHAVTLDVATGTAHGLLGATGAGKSTLMQHLNGLLRPQRGKVRVGEFDLNDPDVDVRAVRRFAGLCFQMPEMQIFEQYVGDEIAYGPRLLGLSRPDLRARVRWAMELVGLDFETFKDRLTFTLSGGERRKVALASTLALQPEVLLLDEPTAGLDPVSHHDLLGHLQQFLDQGMTLVLSSHQMEDLAALTGELTVLHQGTTALSGPIGEIFAQQAHLRALGLDVPVVTQLAEALRAKGWPLPPGIVHSGALLAAISHNSDNV